MNPKKIWLVAVLVLLDALFFYFDLGRYLSLSSLQYSEDVVSDTYGALGLSRERPASDSEGKRKGFKILSSNY